MHLRTPAIPDTHARLPRQQGAVLVLCLVFLLAVTLIATGSMETAIVEERMAGNLQDYRLAFEAAEAALEEGEVWLEDQVLLPATSANGSTAVWTAQGPDPDAGGQDWWLERDADWWTANGQPVAGVAGTASPPRYVIEELHSGLRGQSLALGTGETTTARVFHRVTARGVGANANTSVLLQITYVRPYD